MKVIHIIACILLLSVFSLINVVHAQSVTLIPKWTAQAQFAGYYVAEKMGFYKEEGLDVHVKHPSHSENSFQYLKARRAAGSYHQSITSVNGILCRKMNCKHPANFTGKQFDASQPLTIKRNSVITTQRNCSMESSYSGTTRPNREQIPN